MKFYITPSIDSSKSYYSLYTSVLFVILSFYLGYYKKCPSIVYLTILVVGFVSMIHHARSFEDEYDDVFRYVDIFFAFSLSILIIYFYLHKVTIVFGIFLVSLFVYIQKNCTSPRIKSILHAIFHLLVIFLLLYNVNQTSD